MFSWWAYIIRFVNIYFETNLLRLGKGKSKVVPVL
jgi:hypothetical protein